MGHAELVLEGGKGSPLTVELSAKSAQNFALAVHELATNAAKYGALSSAAGRVNIHWSTSKSNGSELFVFRWEEQGGPPVSSPDQKGFGSVVLEQVMAEYFVEPPHIDFAVGGLRYQLSGELASLKPDEHQRTHVGGDDEPV